MMILTVGLPASGKSTWAKQYKGDNNNIVVIERDWLRKELFGAVGKTVLSPAQEDTISDYQKALIRDFLSAGKTVIISDTNLIPRYRNQLSDIADDMGIAWRIEDFRGVELHTLIQRNRNRPTEEQVPERVIRGMYAKHIERTN